RRTAPTARPGRVRKRNRHRSLVLVSAADAFADPLQAEQPARGEAADGNDQPRADPPQLPFAPEGAQFLFARGRRPVAAAGRRLARIAAGDRGAVEGGVELVLVELEPATQRPSRATAPGPSLLPFDDAGRLPEHVGTL